MSSAVVLVGALSEELGDPGIVTSIQQHVAGGCPLAPLVEAMTPGWDPADRPRLMADMVARAQAIIAHNNEHAVTGELISTEKETPEEDEKPRRGRPRSEKRAAIQEVAKHAGVSESTVRRELAKAEGPVAPKPPSMDTQLGRAAALINEAMEMLRAVQRDVERLSAEFGEKDGRWALLGAVASAVKSANSSVNLVGQARAFRERMEHSVAKVPVGARDVVEGKQAYESSKRPAREKSEDLLAHAGRSEAKAKDTGKTERVSSAQLARESRDKRRWEERQAAGREAALDVAENGPAAYMSPRPIKTGLGGRRLQVQDEKGNTLAEGVREDVADAVMEADPIPPLEDVERAWAEADELFGPGGDE